MTVIRYTGNRNYAWLPQAFKSKMTNQSQLKIEEVFALAREGLRLAIEIYASAVMLKHLQADKPEGLDISQVSKEEFIEEGQAFLFASMDKVLTEALKVEVTPDLHEKLRPSVVTALELLYNTLVKPAA